MIPPRIKTTAARDRELSHQGFRLLCCLVDDRIQHGGDLDDPFTLPWRTAARWLGCEKDAAYEAIGDLARVGYVVKRGRKGVPPMQVFSLGPKCRENPPLECRENPALKRGGKPPFKCRENTPSLTSSPFGKKAEGKEGSVAAVAAGTLEEEATAEGSAVAGPEERTLALGPALAEWRKTQGL